MGKYGEYANAVFMAVGTKIAKVTGLATDDSAKRRYLGGMKPDKYFDEVVYPDLKETFGILGFKYEKGKEVFLAFIEIDDDNSGEVSVKEFHHWLKYPVTKFSERVFTMLDLDNSGFLDFNEFLIGVWNWNTYDAALIAKLAYNIFDVDRTGKIDMAEAEAMIRMIYNVPRADKDLMAKMDINNDGTITLEELESLIEVHNYVLMPAFDLQRSLRQRILGVKYWEAESFRRKIYFSGYDAGAQSSWESIKKILEIKHQARVEEEEKERNLKEMEMRARIEERKAKEMKLREEVQARRAKKAEERRKARESKETKEEKAAKATLDALIEVREDEVVFGDLAKRLVNREKFWKAYEDWVIKARTARKAEGAKRLRLAVGPDVDMRFKEDLLTYEGHKELWTEVRAIYTMEHTDYLYDKGGWLNRTTASLMLRPPTGLDDLDDDDYEPTWFASFRMMFARRKRMKRIVKQAKEIILESFRGTEDERVREELKDREEKQELYFREQRMEQVGIFGGKHSKWERLWDATHGCPYWLNWETQESHWEKVPICHVCDASIPEDDIMCFKCNTARSKYNMAIYDELHPDEMEKELLDEKRDDDDDATLVDDGLIFDDEGNIVERDTKPGITDVRDMDDDDGPPSFYQLYLMKYVNKIAKYWPKKKPKVKLKGLDGITLESMPKIPSKTMVRLKSLWKGTVRILGFKRRPRRVKPMKQTKIVPAIMQGAGV